MSFEVTATRKRPQQFNALAGQDFVVSTLRNAIESGHIAHAYLFSGPRGVGKTTSARLLAKALNCQHGPTADPCGECDNCKSIAKGSCMDVIEIDGASNTGVNDIRTIKEEVLFPPVNSKYKIYIIDEVHMLSQSAFNALLKTIEEPPEYVVFIFATTETQKVPATIRSRCQQFNFQLLNFETIQRLLSEAASETNIKADPDALFWIAKESTGSMRDAYTLFDQVASFSDGNITLDKIREKLGITGPEAIASILKLILEQKPEKAIDAFHNLLSRGISLEQIIKDFTEFFRCILLIRNGVKSEDVLGQRLSDFPEYIVNAYNMEQLEKAMDIFLNLYRDIRYSLNPQFEAELALSRLSRLKYMASNVTVLEQIARLKNDLICGKITSLNPSLKDIKDVVAESGLQDSVGSTITDKTETAPQEKEEQKSPVLAEETRVLEVFNLETLKDVLPSGVTGVEMTPSGLSVCFSSKYNYDRALADYITIKQKICSFAGSVFNVVFTLTGRNSNDESEVVKEKEEPVVKETAPEKKEDNTTMQTDFVEDLILGLKGHRI